MALCRDQTCEANLYEENDIYWIRFCRTIVSLVNGYFTECQDLPDVGLWPKIPQNMAGSLAEPATSDAMPAMEAAELISAAWKEIRKEEGKGGETAKPRYNFHSANYNLTLRENKWKTKRRRERQRREIRNQTVILCRLKRNKKQRESKKRGGKRLYYNCNSIILYFF